MVLHKTKIPFTRQTFFFANLAHAEGGRALSVPVPKSAKPLKSLIDGSRADELFSALTRRHRRGLENESFADKRNHDAEVEEVKTRVSGPVVGSRRERVYVPSSVLPKRFTVFSAGLGGIRS